LFGTQVVASIHKATTIFDTPLTGGAIAILCTGWAVFDGADASSTDLAGGALLVGGTSCPRLAETIIAAVLARTIAI
jgi:hypothetical protein